MNEPLNPYAAPVESAADALSDLGQIEFEAVVEKADITQALSRPWMFMGAALFVVWAFGMSMLMLLGSNRPLTAEPGATVAIVGFQIVVFSLGMIGWNRIGPGVGAYMAMRDPSVVGRIQGHFTADAIHFRRDASYGVYWLSAITTLQTNRRGLVATFDSFRSRLFVIPRSAFHAGGFEAAVERLNHHMSKIQPTPLTGFDPRQRVMPDQPLLLATAEDAVPYEGELLFADLKSTRLETQLLAGKVLLFSIACLGFVGAALIVVLADVVEKLFALLILSVGLFFYYQWLKLRKETQPDQLVGISKGVVDQNGVIDCTAIGQVQYGWWMFQWCEVKDDIILLRTRGLTQYYVVLVKREFESNEHWQYAVKLIQQNVLNK